MVWSRKQWPSSSSRMRSGRRAASATGPSGNSAALVASMKGSSNSGALTRRGPSSGASVPIRAISMLPSTSPAISASVRFSLMVNSSVRQACRQRRKDLRQQIGRDGGNQAEADRPVGLAAHGRRQRPPGHRRCRARARARSMNSRPNGVGRIERFSRSNSGVPQWASIAWICWDERRLADIAGQRGAAEMAGFGHRHGIAHLLERDCHHRDSLSH